jgi:V/A-type H+/Na+-transporting ATPase subunit D
MRIRYPPGRSGRLWLMERLVVAQQAAGILHRKHQALRREESRLAALAEQSGATWAAMMRDAEIWQRRAMILGGRSGLRAAATAADPATARLLWRTEMGVELPAEASCELPSMPSIPGTPALSAAAAAYGSALQAGVEHAAVTAAKSRVSAELALTQRRLRAVRDRWIPQLHVTIAELEVRLDESEREELTRTRLHGPTVPIGQPSQESR